MINILLAIFLLFLSSTIYATEHVINLTVSYKTVKFADKERKAIAVNNQIPAPTLHFKEGDHVIINVYNRLDQHTAIHWHGILLPWQMDGVEGISQKGIPPGEHFQYKFTIHQAGTFWYHAHAGLQEQQGLYGAFLIDPLQSPPYSYNKDYVVVLSDWSNTYPEQILANLKKEGDYYSPRFPLQPSLIKFIHDYRKASKEERKNLLDDYKMMQEMRMSIYDINDVAYDAFLLNGHTKSSPWTAPIKVGDIVRLRFIGAGGNSIFHVKIPGTTMQMIHVQGNDINPYPIQDFTVAPGETYDVLVKIDKNDPYIIYAESRDTVGAAYGALVTSPDQFVDYKKVAPFPEPLPVTREMMAMMMGEMHQGSVPTSMMHTAHTAKTTNHTSMNMTSMSHNMEEGNPDKKIMNHDDMMMDESMHMNHSMHMKEKTKSAQPITTTEKKNQNEIHSEHSDMGMGKKMNYSPRMQPGMSMDHTRSSKNMSQDMPMNHSMKMGHGKSMGHSMDMPTEPTIIGDSISHPSSFYSTSKGTKYENLIAKVKTNNPNTPVAGIIKMELFGYMDRFIWFINGVPEYNAHPIILDPGKRYRIIFTNISMMHHPMHIHGHWFILRKGLGAYDPLLHTIDIPPGATVTVDVDTDVSGQWFFHCHMLYHMMTGMSRVFQYSTLIEITKGKAKPQNIVENTPYYNRPILKMDEVKPIDVSLVKHPMAHPPGLWLATFLDVGADPFDNSQRVTFKGLYGPDYNKLELFTDDAEITKGIVENADIDIFYWHLISQFWAIKGGVNYYYRPAETPYWQPGIGIEGLMPYFIDMDVRSYLYSGSAKLDIELSRDTQISNNFFIRLGARGILASKTVERAEIGSGLNQIRYLIRPYYRILPGLNVFAEFEHEQDYGAFKNLQTAAGESDKQNTLTFGLSMLF